MRKFGLGLIFVLLSFILMAFLFISVKAAALVHADLNGHLTPRSPRDALGRRYRVNLNPAPHVVHFGAGATPAELALLAADFPGWVFANAAARPGVLNEVHYDADVDAALPNVFTIDYVSGGVPPPPGWMWQWVQIIITNDPVPAAVAAGWDGFYVDPQPNDDPAGPWFDMPFYWTDAERISYSAGGVNCPVGVDIRFTDRPRRPLADAPVDWTAHLYLVYWDGLNPGTVQICDGIEWGFQISWICEGFGPNVSGGVGGDKFTSEMHGIHTGDTTYPRKESQVPPMSILHAEEGLIDISYPESTQWHELAPAFSKEYHLQSWEDTNKDGKLSRSDQIEMWQKPGGPKMKYHVEKVTVTIAVALKPDLVDIMYLEFCGTFEEFLTIGDPGYKVPGPISTLWHEVYPDYSKCYHLTSWEDTDGGDDLTVSDQIDFEELPYQWWHVEEMAIDIIISPKAVGGVWAPVDKFGLLAPYIGLTSTIVIATVATAIYAKRIKRLKKK